MALLNLPSQAVALSYLYTTAWTPTLTLGGGSTGMTYSSQIGSYTRIGSMVTASGTVALSALGSSTGTAVINGFPFTAATTNNTMVTKIITTVVTLTGTNNFAYAVMGDSTKTMTLGQGLCVGGSASTTAVLTHLNLANTSSISFFISYLTSDS